jgi:GT2 family glycosyltransferase
MNTRQLWMPPIPDDGRVHLIDGYCGGSCAIRRDMFLRVGGMREISAHQEEERDFSIRALDQGYVVRAGRADVMHHYESPVRNVKRNTVSKSMARTLFVFNNVPHPYMIPNLLVTSVNLIRFGLKRGHALWTMQGIFKGLMVILQSGLRTRRAVSRSTFRLTRLLSKSGGRMTLDEVAAFLRPIEPNQPANVRASG